MPVESVDIKQTVMEKEHQRRRAKGKLVDTEGVIVGEIEILYKLYHDISSDENTKTITIKLYNEEEDPLRIYTDEDIVNWRLEKGGEEYQVTLIVLRELNNPNTYRVLELLEEGNYKHSVHVKEEEN
jgi:rRNA processing protein Krr1/Pno1